MKKAATAQYPNERLREELTRIVGLEPEELDRGKLRTLAYKMRLNVAEDASADALAALILDASKGGGPGG